MEIIWHGHSCFELVSGGYSLVLDPYYHRELCGYPELRLTADAVLCSHGHYGHGWTEAVELRRGGAPDPFEVEVLETHHDVLGGRLRGENCIHILRAEGLKIVHLGDLGCRLTDEQAERIRGCDAIMAPAGGILTIEPTPPTSSAWPRARGWCCRCTTAEVGAATAGSGPWTSLRASSARAWCGDMRPTGSSSRPRPRLRWRY